MNAEDLKQRYGPQEVRTIETERQIGCARFSPCGRYLYTGGYDGLVRRWDFQKEEPAELSALTGHHGWVERMAFDGENKRLFTADTWGQVRCWDYLQETPALTWNHDNAHDGWIRSIAVSADGRMLATAGRDRQVRVWSAEDGQLLHELPGHPHEVFCVAFHPDSQALVSGDLKGTIKHWNLQSGGCERDIDATSMYFYDRIQDVCGLRILDFQDEGRTLLAAGSEPTRAGRAYGIPTVHLYDWKTGERRGSLQQGEAKDGYIFDLVQHPDGFLILASSGTPGTGKLFFRRKDADEPFVTNSKMNNCHAAALHPDGTLLAVAATNRRSQGNGAVLDKEGNYKGNWSPLHVLQLGTAT